MLVINDLNLFYKSKHILNISLTAKQGEIIGIVGENGTGKSTFSRALCGIHKKRSGDIYWNQKKLKIKQSMRLAYMVMQDVNYELFGESVYDECCLGIKNVNKEEIEETLKILNLYQYKDKHPNTLSGGQKQRVAVAVSMICKKDLLIFDEPTSGLDFDGMMQVSYLLKKLALKNKIIFVVTHDYEFLCQCCHRVICFDNHRFSHDFVVNNQTEKLLKEIFKI